MRRVLSKEHENKLVRLGPVLTSLYDPDQMPRRHANFSIMSEERKPNQGMSADRYILLQYTFQRIGTKETTFKHSSFVGGATKFDDQRTV